MLIRRTDLAAGRRERDRHTETERGKRVFVLRTAALEHRELLQSVRKEGRRRSGSVRGKNEIEPETCQPIFA